MNLEGTGISCGVMQMEGISYGTSNSILIQLGEEMYLQGMNCAFVTWSDRWGRNRGGNKLYHFIRRRFPKSNLQRTKAARNPNSGNKICLYIWQIPRGFKTWWKENGGDIKKYCDNYCSQYGCDCSSR